MEVGSVIWRWRPSIGRGGWRSVPNPAGFKTILSSGKRCAVGCGSAGRRIRSPAGSAANPTQTGAVGVGGDIYTIDLCAGQRGFATRSWPVAFVPGGRAGSPNVRGKGPPRPITGMVLISERPPEVETVPSPPLEGDLILERGTSRRWPPWWTVPPFRDADQNRQTDRRNMSATASPKRSPPPSRAVPLAHPGIKARDGPHTSGSPSTLGSQSSSPLRPRPLAARPNENWNGLVRIPPQSQSLKKHSPGRPSHIAWLLTTPSTNPQLDDTIRTTNQLVALTT